MTSNELVFYTVTALPVVLWSCDAINHMTWETRWWERFGYILLSAGLLGELAGAWWPQLAREGAYAADKMFYVGLMLLTSGFLWRRHSRVFLPKGELECETKR